MMERKLHILIAVITISMIISCQTGYFFAAKNPYELWEEQPNEKIVFMSRAQTPEGELYLLDKNGETTRLTYNNKHENNPALSYDGKKIAFNAGEEGDQLTWEIYVLDLETGKETQLTHNNVIDAHPDWSPDGNRIVFGSFRDAQGEPSGTADIYTMNSIDGSSKTQLTKSPWEDNDPEWSPDGTRIVFKSTRRTQQSGREEIFVMNNDGTEVVRLSTTNGWQSDHDPSWNPNGEEILFTRFEGKRIWYDTKNFATDWEELTPWNVHRVDLNGNVEKLTSSINSGWGVVLYSSDSNAILFGTIEWITDEDNRVVGGMHRLILMNTDGTNQRQLIPDDNHTGTLEYFDW